MARIRDAWLERPACAGPGPGVVTVPGSTRVSESSVEAPELSRAVTACWVEAMTGAEASSSARRSASTLSAMSREIASCRVRRTGRSSPSGSDRHRRPSSKSAASKSTRSPCMPPGKPEIHRVLTSRSMTAGVTPKCLAASATVTPGCSATQAGRASSRVSWSEADTRAILTPPPVPRARRRLAGGTGPPGARIRGRGRRLRRQERPRFRRRRRDPRTRRR